MELWLVARAYAGEKEDTMSQSEGRKIKGGKPIARQQRARARKLSQITAYYARLRRRKLAQVKKSNGPAFARSWEAKHMYASLAKKEA